MSIFFNKTLQTFSYHFSMILLILSLASCGKMDETYEGFTKNGTIVYTGKADSLKYFAGNERVELYFLLADPKVYQAKLYWNDKRDSLVIPVTKTKNVDTIRTLLTKAQHGITEGTYLFDVYTYDKNGNRSIKVQTAARVYGATYQSSLLSRPIQQITRTSTDVTINWYNAEEGSSGTELVYTTVSGALKTVLVPVTETQTLLTSFKAGTRFKYRTLFLPEPSAIDTFYTPYIELLVN